MEVSEVQEVKQLGKENARLEKLVADLSLDKDALPFARCWCTKTRGEKKSARSQG
jgi:hypothetical protein